MRVVHLELAEANDFVARFHRHHKPAVGHRFSIGCVGADGAVVGVAIVGRPVARAVDFRTTVEVVRLATNGHPNACSFLYGACARAAAALGYAKIQTYILDTEPGTSLKASGWAAEATTDAKHWGNRANRRRDQPECAKVRYGKILTLNPKAKEADTHADPN